MKIKKVIFLIALAAVVLLAAALGAAYSEKEISEGFTEIGYPDDIVVAYKPVIYLYPEESTQVNVKVSPNGAFTCTYPEYNGGWNVTAEPDGTLYTDDGRQFGCLFWEAELSMDFDISAIRASSARWNGYCIRGEDTAQFLEWALAEQGLSARESSEFIMYWLPLMQHNEYNVISFLGEEYDSAAPLEIEPAPDSVKRVFMVYCASDVYVDIPAQDFESFERNGFTVVEWGGSCIAAD